MTSGIVFPGEGFSPGLPVSDEMERAVWLCSRLVSGESWDAGFS